VRTRTLVVVVVVVILLFSSALVIADEHSVNFDAGRDFSKLKTFTFRQTRCDSNLPELNNSLYIRNLGEIIRTELVAKGMKEVPNGADLLIDYKFDGLGLSGADQPGRYPGQGRKGTLYVQGTLTIDMFDRQQSKLVWEGIYRELEDTASRLARRYRVDAKSLLSEFPPKKK